MPPASTEPPRPTPHELLEHLDWVRSLAAKLAFDADHRGDLEQEIWRAALQRRPAAEAPLRAWLVGIGRNLAKMTARSAARRRRRETAAARTGEAPSPATLAEHSETQQRVLAAVNKLPEAMRDVVLLRYFEELPPRAIATQLGVPVATVRTRLQRAQARLRQQLDDDFGDRRTWALACVAIARPQHIAAAAGSGATAIHLAVITMQVHKSLAIAGLLAFIAMPTTYLLLRSSPTPLPDYGQSAPVASLLEGRSSSPNQPAPALTRTAIATDSQSPRLLGTVVDVHGVPVAGAVVRRSPWWLYETRIEAGEVHRGDVETVSSADGSFTLPAGEQALPVECEQADYLSERADVLCKPDLKATIVMLRTHEVPLLVEVKDRTTGMPAPRFLVTATTLLDQTTPGVISTSQRQLSDPLDGVGTEGMFRGTTRFVEGLPLAVRVRCPGHGRGEWDDDTDVLLSRNITPEPGQAIELAFLIDFGGAERNAPRVQRGRTIEAATGTPLAGIELIMRAADQERWTRVSQSLGDGTFAIAMPRSGAAGQLTVQHDDYQTRELAARPAEELVVRLQPRATLRCRIIDGSGQPIARAPVLFLTRNRKTHQRVRTDDQGEVFFEHLLADRYHVFLLTRSRDADENAIANGSYAVEVGEHVEVTLQAEPPDTVRVIGTIVGGAPGLVPAFVPLTSAGRWVQGKAQGRGYDAGGLKQGDYIVFLLPADDGDRQIAVAVLPRVRIKGLGTVVVDLAVPTGAVRGRLVLTRSDGAALRVVAVPEVPAGCMATEILAGRRFTEAFGVALAADGAFEVSRVADGAFRLEVRDGARVVAQRVVTVQGSLDVGDWTIDG